jgi:hypothetical protein
MYLIYWINNKLKFILFNYIYPVQYVQIKILLIFDYLKNKLIRVSVKNHS